MNYQQYVHEKVVSNKKGRKIQSSLLEPMQPVQPIQPKPEEKWVNSNRIRFLENYNLAFDQNNVNDLIGEARSRFHL